MKILVINSGSSSLKYQLIDMETEEVIAKGNCERIGIDGKIKHQNLETGAVYEKEIAMPNHTVATKIVIDALLSAEYGSVKSMDEIEAVGHRIVHGGAYFSESVLLTDEVLAKLELCRDLAPLHTGAHIMGIQGCLAAMPKTPQVLVFDTAFHTASMPDYAYVYPVSYDMYEKYAVRRYGAHGTSHRYVSGECIKLLGGKAEGTKIVTCHLGNGSSVTAVDGGKSVDTSMGFTPLAGLQGTLTGISTGRYLVSRERTGNASVTSLFSRKPETDRWKTSLYAFGFNPAAENILSVKIEMDGKDSVFNEEQKVDLTPYLRGFDSDELSLELDLHIGKELTIGEPVVIPDWEDIPETELPNYN